MALPRGTAPQWRKSTRSGNSGNCVEVADTGAAVLVRDTKQHGRGPVLHLAPAAWAALLVGCKAGEFDL